MLVITFFLSGVTKEGVLTSPKFPGLYPNNYKKRKTIKGGGNSNENSTETVLVLEFTAFDIASSKKCKNDYLSIQDADGTVLMGKRCGSNLPAKITSRTNTVYVFFKTNKYKASTGWSIFWRDSSSEDAQVVSSGKQSN